MPSHLDEDKAALKRQAALAKGLATVADIECNAKADVAAKRGCERHLSISDALFAPTSAAAK